MFEVPWYKQAKTSAFSQSLGDTVVCDNLKITPMFVANLHISGSIHYEINATSPALFISNKIGSARDTHILTDIWEHHTIRWTGRDTAGTVYGPLSCAVAATVSRCRVIAMAVGKLYSSPT